MKQAIKTLALATTGLVVGVVVWRGSKSKTYTITNLDDEVLADISSQDIISHKSVKVYVDDKLATVIEVDREDE